MSDAILEPDETFPFLNLALTSPIMVAGGNYFIKYLVNKTSLYIQPPKCYTRQGIVKAGAGSKKFYCDLLFTNENESFVKWVEELETFSQTKLFENRSRWFESDLDQHDIENCFTNSLKIYKSGKFYILRVWIPTRLGECSLKLFDESERPLNIQEITEQSQVLTILEVQGIRCSSRNFQIDFEMKQMMLLRPEKLFERCIISPKHRGIAAPHSTIPVQLQEPEPVQESEPEPTELESEPEPEIHMEMEKEPNLSMQIQENVETPSVSFAADTQGGESSLETTTTTTLEEEPEPEHETLEEENATESPIDAMVRDTTPTLTPKTEEDPPTDPTDHLTEIQDIALDPDEENSVLHLGALKTRNQVFYEKYRQAREKAKLDQKAALASYLQAKTLKRQYHFESVEDSDSEFDVSDGEDDDDDDHDHDHDSPQENKTKI